MGTKGGVWVHPKALQLLDGCWTLLGHPTRMGFGLQHLSPSLFHPPPSLGQSVTQRVKMLERGLRSCVLIAALKLQGIVCPQPVQGMFVGAGNGQHTAPHDPSCFPFCQQTLWETNSKIQGIHGTSSPCGVSSTVLPSLEVNPFKTWKLGNRSSVSPGLASSQVLVGIKPCPSPSSSTN